MAQISAYFTFCILKENLAFGKHESIGIQAEVLVFYFWFKTRELD